MQAFSIEDCNELGEPKEIDPRDVLLAVCICVCVYVCVYFVLVLGKWGRLRRGRAVLSEILYNPAN